MTHAIASTTVALFFAAIIVIAMGAAVPTWLPVAVAVGVLYLTVTSSHI